MLKLNVLALIVLSLVKLIPLRITNVNVVVDCFNNLKIKSSLFIILHES